MRNNYSKERDRWDRISGQRDMNIRAPSDDWLGVGYSPSGPVEQIVRTDKTPVPPGMEGMTGKQLRQAEKRMRRAEKERAELAGPVEELLLEEHYAESGWGGF